MTSVLVTSVTFEAPNVAMSVVAFGTLCGLQLAAVFQSPLIGFLAHVALPARQGRCAAENSSAAATKNLSLLNDVVMGEPVESRLLIGLRTHRSCCRRYLASAST